MGSFIAFVGGVFVFAGVVWQIRIARSANSAPQRRSMAGIVLAILGVALWFLSLALD